MKRMMIFATAFLSISLFAVAQNTSNAPEAASRTEAMTAPVVVSVIPAVATSGPAVVASGSAVGPAIRVADTPQTDVDYSKNPYWAPQDFIYIMSNVGGDGGQ